MKELNNFRDFLNENKGIAADYADRILGAGDAEFVDPIELIDFYAGNLDDLPEPMKADLFMANLKDIKAMVMQETELHEGTWSLGTLDAMKDVMKGLANIRDKADLAMDPSNKGKGFVDGFKMALGNEAFDARMYRVFGDDSFHDHIAAARREANVGDFDRAKNSINDALARAAELFDYQYKSENENLEEGEVEESFIGDLATRIRKRRAAKKEKERFTKGLDMKRGGAPEIDPEFTKGLEENDAVLDEMAQSMGIFKEIDMMVGNIKDQMSPDDAFDSLVSEFEAISGGTQLLYRALKNISLDNNLMEEKEEE